MKTILIQIRQFLTRRRHVAGLLATVMLFAFSTNSSALWPAGVYRFDAITGSVLDKETRKPIEGVVVVGHWGLETNTLMNSSYSGPLVVKETITDKDGKFTIPASIATDVLKRGHFNAEMYPEIAFFKSGYEFTVYRHSGIDPITGDPVTYNTAKGDEYLMPKVAIARSLRLKEWRDRPTTFGVLDAFSCLNFEQVTPRLLNALRQEFTSIATVDRELADYFASSTRLERVERCIKKQQAGGVEK